MSNQKLILDIKNSFDLGLTYFEGVFEGEDIKIRMNKDHGRNGRRNDNEDFHNLSLVSESANGSNQDSSFVNIYHKVQQQYWGISDWQDAEAAIVEFFDRIEDEL